MTPICLIAVCLPPMKLRWNTVGSCDVEFVVYSSQIIFSFFPLHWHSIPDDSKKIVFRDVQFRVSKILLFKVLHNRARQIVTCSVATLSSVIWRQIQDCSLSLIQLTMHERSYFHTVSIHRGSPWRRYQKRPAFAATLSIIIAPHPPLHSELD